MFAHFCDDLFLCVRGVGFSGVGQSAGDADFADCLEFVCIADDVADEGVVWRQKAVVVERCSCEDCFVFGAVGNILDDLFDVCVVADVFVAELIEPLFECAVMVVFVVCDVVQPRGGDCIFNQVAVLSAVGVVLLDEE